MTIEARLDAIVDNISAGLLEIIRAPRGLDVIVGEFVIHDPSDRRGIEAGEVILAVGLETEERAAVAVVRQAGESGAAAVIFKTTPAGVPQSVVDASAEAGVALLATPPDIVWGQLHALLRTARAATGVAAEIGPGGAPVGDLFALANAVSAMVGGATTIEDTNSTVLAYSSTDEPIDDSRRQTILGRRVPDTWRTRLEADGVFRTLWTDGIVRIDYRAIEPGFRPRIAVAVRAGGETLGSIWVSEGNHPLGDEAEAALREAGRIAALHLLRHRAGEDIERRRRADLLRGVLDGRLPVDVLSSSLGVTATSAVTVIALELQIDPAAGLADQGLVVDRAQNLVAVHCEAYRHHAALVTEGRLLYVLLVDRDGLDEDRLPRFAAELVAQLREGLKVAARAGIGPTVPLMAVLDSKRDADQVLRALTDAGDPRAVARIEEVRSRAILLELRDIAAREPRLAAGKLSVLVELDRDGRTMYIDTLRAFLDAFGDVGTAAAAVSVHPNTFRYRLRRLLELSAIDLDDPVERLIIHLQLTLLTE